MILEKLRRLQSIIRYVSINGNLSKLLIEKAMHPAE